MGCDLVYTQSKMKIKITKNDKNIMFCLVFGYKLGFELGVKQKKYIYILLLACLHSIPNC